MSDSYESRRRATEFDRLLFVLTEAGMFTLSDWRRLRFPSEDDIARAEAEQPERKGCSVRYPE